MNKEKKQKSIILSVLNIAAIIATLLMFFSEILNFLFNKPLNINSLFISTFIALTIVSIYFVYKIWSKKGKKIITKITVSLIVLFIFVFLLTIFNTVVLKISGTKTTRENYGIHVQLMERNNIKAKESIQEYYLSLIDESNFNETTENEYTLDMFEEIQKEDYYFLINEEVRISIQQFINKEKTVSSSISNEVFEKFESEALDLIINGNYADAKKIYEMLIELGGDNANVWNNLGVLYSKDNEDAAKIIAAYNTSVMLGSSVAKENIAIYNFRNCQDSQDYEKIFKDNFFNSKKLEVLVKTIYEEADIKKEKATYVDDLQSKTEIQIEQIMNELRGQLCFITRVNIKMTDSVSSLYPGRDIYAYRGTELVEFTQYASYNIYDFNKHEEFWDLLYSIFIEEFDIGN